MKPINLKTENLTNPIGLVVRQPRLSWTCQGATKQAAYRIVARTANTQIWDSGLVRSDAMSTTFPIPVSAKTRVTWTVTLWDQGLTQAQDNAWAESLDNSATAFFETTLLEESDFTAKWISGNYKVNKKKRYPVDCFKKTFTSTDVKSARLYITACGLYQTRINGKKVGNFCLSPGYTDYNKRIQLQTYDVTDLLKNGSNDLCVELADGWYRGSTGAWGLRNQYGTQTKLYVQLELTGADGKVVVICSDQSWSWSNDGPIRFADNKDGEIVEAFRQPSYEGKAKVVQCKVIPTASNNVPITEHETFTPSVITTPRGSKVLDFHQNIAGYISFSLNAQNGQIIKLRFGEMFDKDGEFTQSNIQCANKKRTKVTPLQQILYTCKDGVNQYKTKFAIFGFQYVLIETDVEWKPEDFTAIAVYSDMRPTLQFDCSNELINKLVEITTWSAKNNHADVPTDCPTRERHGWTGDAQIFAKTACYMFDYQTMARKYLKDMYDWQKKDGKLPQIVPYGGVDFYMATMNGSVGWADAGIIIPYTLWKMYGDRSTLEEYYDRMKLYAKFMIRRCGKKTLLSKPLHLKHRDRRFAVNYGQSYGEWAEPADICPMNWKDMIFPHPEVSTAYTSYIMGLMCEIATELGRSEDIPLYKKYAEGTKMAYQALRRTKEFPLDTDRQAMHVRALYFKLLDKEEMEYSQKRLIRALDNYGWRLGTGFLSTPFILDVLTEINPEYAYRLLENQKMPGWLFMPKMGATTIWESWEGPEAQGGVASLDHYSKGAVCQWIVNTMCGIRMGEGPNSFVIKPTPGGSLEYARASYESVYGLVESSWQKKDGKIFYRITIPSNCTAQLILPKCKPRQLDAGKYEFTV